MSNHADNPTISIILPVYNGQDTLDRAIQSVALQAFADWQLLAVDDASTDDSLDILQAWANIDPRIQILKTPENSGPCAARNLGLRHARGHSICYLDQDDEFYADYLALVEQSRHAGDVLVFRYDLVDDDLPDAHRDLPTRSDREFNVYGIDLHTPGRLAPSQPDRRSRQIQRTSLDQ